MYHEGEIAIQTRAGVREMAERIGRGIRDVVPDAGATFLSERPFAVVGWIDRDGSPWASPLAGPEGFMSAVDARTVRVRTKPGAGDPLGRLWPDVGEVGLVAIDFATRRRMRVNGSTTSTSQGFDIHVRQVYSNCPKYTQVRELRGRAGEADDDSRIEASALTPAQARLVERADTFFIASYHAIAGADASHRGGLPGFVDVLDSTTLSWPDYAGNTMLQTLGNIESTQRAGLLFIDFDNGTTLQVTGTARVLGTDDRRVELHLSRAIEIAGGFPFVGPVLEYSPFNPS